MPLTVDEIYKEALLLPNESKISLSERLAEHLAQNVDSKLERLHLDTANRRKNEIRSGTVMGIEGGEALAQVRRKFNV